jgi:hypothetical protein
MTEALGSYETSVLTIATRHNVLEGDFLYRSPRYAALTTFLSPHPTQHRQVVVLF